ncbi:MAG: hypothetical protein R6U95_00675 [Bacteroidales bacterium]
MKTITIGISLVFLLINMSYAQNDISYNLPGTVETQVITKEDTSGVLLYTAELFDNELHGTYIEYYEDGSVKEKRNYKSGLLHGTSFRYSQDGELLAKAEYEDNVKVGTWVFIDVFSNQKISVVYENGVKKGISYYKNGLCVDTVMY